MADGDYLELSRWNEGVSLELRNSPPHICVNADTGVTYTAHLAFNTDVAKPAYTNQASCTQDHVATIPIKSAVYFELDGERVSTKVIAYVMSTKYLTSTQIKNVMLAYRDRYGEDLDLSPENCGMRLIPSDLEPLPVLPPYPNAQSIKPVLG